MKTELGLIAVAFAASASAQTNGRFILMSSNDVTPSSPATTISVYAAWDQVVPGDFILGAVNYDLVAAEAEFTAATLLFATKYAPNTAGTPDGPRVTGASIGQVHIPAAGIYANPANPALLAEYVWTTEDFSPRSIALRTENTTHFTLVPWGPGPVSINLVSLGALTPGSGSITVVPAPSAALIALPLLARRRRPPGASR